MPYCTQNDILQRIPETVLARLTDDVSGEYVNEEIVITAIADADEEIDAYLSMHYSLPFTTVPAIVGRMSADLAVCRLYARCAHIELPPQWSERCKSVGRMLEKIAEGRLEINVQSSEDSDMSGVYATTSRDDRKFTISRSYSGSLGSLDNY